MTLKHNVEPYEENISQRKWKIQYQKKYLLHKQKSG